MSDDREPAYLRDEHGMLQFDHDDQFADLSPAELAEERSIRRGEEEMQDGPEHDCLDCGEPLPVTAECRCERCIDRRKAEAIIESGNDYRRHSQIALDLENVRRKAREYYDSLVLSDDHSSDIDPGTGRE